jgi:hypothetical protein
LISMWVGVAGRGAVGYLVFCAAGFFLGIG